MVWAYPILVMRTEVTTKTLYTFEELGDKAKERAIEKESESQGEMFDAATDGSYEDFERIASILGISFEQRPIKTVGGSTRYEPTIYYSGFWSQGDGACFEGTYEYKKGSKQKIRAYAPQDTKLHRIADELVRLQKPFNYALTATMEHRGHYYHSGCMTVEVDVVDEKYMERDDVPYDELVQLMRDFADWMYRQLEKEYEYRTGREQCVESIEANEFEYDEDGNIQ